MSIEFLDPTRPDAFDVVTDHVGDPRPRGPLLYVRQWFGPVCDDLKPLRPVGKPIPHLEANHFEEILTQAIAAFLTRAKRERNYEPRTVKRYREVIMRVFNWAMAHRGIRKPGDRNPVKRVERAKDAQRQAKWDSWSRDLFVFPPCVEFVQRLNTENEYDGTQEIRRNMVKGCFGETRFVYSESRSAESRSLRNFTWPKRSSRQETERRHA